MQKVYNPNDVTCRNLLQITSDLFKIVADLNLFVIKIIEEYKYGYRRIGFEMKICYKRLDL